MVGGCGVAAAESVTITGSALANVEIPVDIRQGHRDNGPVANVHELAAERPDAAVHVVEGTDHSFSGGDLGDKNPRVDPRVVHPARRRAVDGHVLSESNQRKPNRSPRGL